MNDSRNASVQILQAGRDADRQLNAIGEGQVVGVLQELVQRSIKALQHNAEWGSLAEARAERVNHVLVL